MFAERLTDQIIGAAVAVHRQLGPGLLESAYQACMTVEMLDRGLEVRREVAIPIVYRNARVDCGYRVDFIVESTVIVELKSVARMDRIHTAQLLTYLKLSGCRVGLLINFNVHLLKQGIRRVML